MASVAWDSDQPVPVPDGDIGYIVEIADTFGPGSHAPTLDFSFGDGSTHLTLADNLTKLLPFSQTHRFTRAEVGGVTSSVTAYGTYSAYSLSMGVDVEEIIIGLSLAIIPEIYHMRTGTGGQVVFNISVLSGSHVDFLLDYDDGTNESFRHALMFASSYDLYYTHSYENPGEYYPVLYAQNQVSSQNATLPTHLLVVTPITMLYVTVPPTAEYPPGTVEIVVSPAYGYAPPTGVMCTWMVNAFHVNVSDAAVLSVMQTHHQTIQLSEEHVGLAHVWINCSNPVSYAISRRQRGTDSTGLWPASQPVRLTHRSG